MNEIIFNSGNYFTLLNEAETLGFVIEDADGNKSIVTNGTFEGGGGWFLNIVGDVYEPIVGPTDPENPQTPAKREGYWGRLRINGLPETMPLFSSAIIQYLWSQKLTAWTFDGVTPAPDWVNNIGLIA
jgi:hypothetical protein